MYLSLVIPAYNEAQRIGATLTTAVDYFERQGYASEIIVVDDGSLDNTVDVVRKIQKTSRVPIHLKRLPENQGKGFAVRAGMLEMAAGKFRFYYDADGSTPVEEVERCSALFDNDADIVIGSRALPGSVIQQRQAWYRENMGRCYNLIEKALGITSYSDTQCGFKGFTAQAAEICFSRQTVNRFSFDAELLFIAAKHGLRILELPVSWKNSPNSKVSPVGDAVRMFFDLLAIRWKNLRHRYD